MNNLIVGYWNKKKEKLKNRFRSITDADLQFKEGKENEMMEMLSHKLGKTREEMRFIIEELK